MKLYLTKHKSGDSRDITGLVVTWTWSGDKATISRKLELEIAYVEDSDLPVPEIGDLVTMEDTERLFQGVVLRRTLGSEDHTLSATAFDYGIYLQKNDCTAKFTGATPEEITRSLCAEKEIPVASLPTTGIQLRRKFSGVKINQAITTDNFGTASAADPWSKDKPAGELTLAIGMQLSGPWPRRKTGNDTPSGTLPLACWSKNGRSAPPVWC